MDTTSYIALSRQMALQERMTVAATNIANMATTGYRAEEMRFEQVLVEAGAPGEISFVQDVGLVRDVSPGPMVATGNDLDFAIGGPGYFALSTADGTRYTRNGHFQRNLDGEIVSTQGHPVLDEGGSPVVLPLDQPNVTVASDGTISTDDGIVARLQLVDFADQQSLERVGDSLYATNQTPVQVGRPEISQGMLEGSNVQSVLEMTRMMETVRAFQNTQRMLELHHDMVRQTIDSVMSATG